MKRAGCAFLGCLGVLGLVLAGLGFVLLVRSSGPPEPVPTLEPGPTGAPSARPRPSPSPTPDPDAYVEDAGELRDFQRVDEAGRYRLSYGFVDYQGNTHRVTCGIERADLERQRRGYGYDPKEIERLENARLEALVRGQIERRGLTGHFHFDVRGNEYTWGFEVQGDPSLEERARLAQQSRELEAWIQRDLDAALERIRTELYGARGILNSRHKLSIDYASIVRQSTAPLEDCFQALERSGRNLNRRQYLGMLLAFFQELAYELPPDLDGRKETLGFWMPTEVLVRGKGDCDSKSAAFAALWRHFPEGLLMIVLPEHVLLGVEARPGPGERHVRLGNRYYVLCEPAGPGKLHPGSSDMSGSYEYVKIEPWRPGER